MGCKVRIGNNDDFVVIGSYPGAANSHPPDHPGSSSYVDAIPDAEWLFDEQYQSGHPVGHDRLQAKAHTDAERPSQDRQRVQVYSGCLQPDHETNDIDHERNETRQNVTMLWVERGTVGTHHQTKPVSTAISRTAPKSTLAAKEWRTSDCSRIDCSAVRLCHAAPFGPLRAIVLVIGIFTLVFSWLLEVSNRNRYNTPHRFPSAILFAFQRGVTDRGFSSRSASSLLKSLH